MDLPRTVSGRYSIRSPLYSPGFIIKSIGILGVFLLLSLAITWPLIPRWTTVFWGLGGDGYSCVWGAWLRRTGLISGGVNPFICAPYGEIVGQPLQPVYDYLFLIFSIICGNDVQGYNLLAFLSFPLTALATYFFLYKIHQDTIAAFFGGLIFGFCPAAVIHSLAGHIGFSFNIFIPLLFLAGLVNRERRTAGSAVVVGILYSMLSLTCLYWGYFLIFSFGGFVVWDCLTGWAKGQHKRFFFNYGICAITFLLIFIPLEFSALREQVLASRIYLETIGHSRPLSHLAALSARPWEYFIPSCNHFLVGKWVESFLRTKLHGSNFPEQTLFLGFVPLCIVGFGFALRRKIMNSHLAPYFSLFLILALLMAVLSAPPYIPIGIFKFPLASFFTYRIAPMFRAYNRFGLLVVFFLASASSVVIASMRRKVSNRIYLSLATLACILSIIEFGVGPQRRSVSRVDYIPQVIQWLSQKPRGLLIVEYPMMMPEEASFLEYLFWQRVHKQRLVNGALPNNAPSWALFRAISDFSSPSVPGLLRELGVDYVILHGEKYQEGPIPLPLKPWNPPHLADLRYNSGEIPSNPLFGPPVETFGKDQVFIPPKS